MAASNRAKLITKLHAELKKKFSLPPSQPSRPLLEHILYACLLQDAPYDLADEGLAKCEQEFFDWNEVRVTTVTELTQVLGGMPDPAKAARRLKETLQALFEEFYSFDLDHLKKENLGKAVAKLETMSAVTPFVLSYTVQHGLGGHSIPIDYAAMVIMLSTGIASQNEAAGGKVPGLERAIPKNKGVEFGSLLHQAGVALLLDHGDKKARALIDAVAKGSSARYDEWEASKKAAIRRVKRRRREEKAAASDTDEVSPSKKPSTSKDAGKAEAKPGATKTSGAKEASVKTSKESKTKNSTSKTPTEKGVAKSSAVKPAGTKATTKASDKPAAATKRTKKAAATTKAADSKKKKTATKKSAKKATKKTSKKSAASASKSSTTKKSSSRKLSKRKPR